MFWPSWGRGRFRCRPGCPAGHYGYTAPAEHDARDNSTVLPSRLFSKGPMLGIVDSSQNHTRPARSLARLGTLSAGAVCRAAEIRFRVCCRNKIWAVIGPALHRLSGGAGVSAAQTQSLQSAGPPQHPAEMKDRRHGKHAQRNPDCDFQIYPLRLPHLDTSQDRGSQGNVRANCGPSVWAVFRAQGCSSSASSSRR